MNKGEEMSRCICKGIVGEELLQSGLSGVWGRLALNI